MKDDEKKCYFFDFCSNLSYRAQEVFYDTGDALLAQDLPGMKKHTQPCYKNRHNAFVRSFVFCKYHCRVRTKDFAV